MKEHPILFSGQMVRAILAGRKTQTRRVIKPQPIKLDDGRFILPLDQLPSPYGIAGDHLWVKETFARHPEFHHEFVYRADAGGDYQGAAQGYFKWKPSIFCTRAASRITLEIVSVRVERLQDISEEDAKAEGCEPHPPSVIDGKIYRRPFNCDWEQIYGKESWDANPWVWVVEFKRV